MSPYSFEDFFWARNTLVATPVIPVAHPLRPGVIFDVLPDDNTRVIGVDLDRDCHIGGGEW